MRINGGNSTNQIGRSAGQSRAQSSSGGFSVPQDTASPAQTQRAVQTSAVQDVSSLLALQGVEDSLHGRKRKAVRRGNRMLDLLEDVRLGLLSGSLSVGILHQLERLCGTRDTSGDERIDDLLEEIGLRAQVELAKLEAHAAAQEASGRK